MTNESKKQEVRIIPFSHLDLFWGGTREECLSRGTRIFIEAMDLLEKYPEYRFMIESTNFMENFLSCNPEETDRMKRLIREGRLEVIPMRSIIYSHLPSGETTIRNLLYGKEFCREKLDASPTIMSMSDIPGVIAQLPQIAKLGGMTEIVLSRGFHEHTDHVYWTAPDGTGIRAYCPWHYANLCGMVSKENYDEMVKKEPGFEEYVSKVDYPQIIHWGMDLYILNETILKNIQRWNAEGHRKLSFSTFREFFDEEKTDEVKQLKGEIPSTWPHIETSWPDIWPLDVPIENNMMKAEFFASLNTLSGYAKDYPAREMKQAWLNLLDSMDHNQNGIGGEIADRDKLHLKQSAGLVAEQCVDKYAWRIAARTTSPHEGASPVVIFNPLSWKRSGTVTVRAVCYGSSFASCYDFSSWKPAYDKYLLFRLIDSDGKEIPYKKEKHLQMLADTFEITFYAKDIPAFGCKTYYVELLNEGARFESPFQITFDRDNDLKKAGRCAGCDTVENKFFKLDIDRITGELTLFDKTNDRILFEKAGIIGLEERRGEYIYNMQLSGRSVPAVIDSIELVENNAVYCRFEIKGSVYSTPFTQRITISADEPVIDIENIIDWQRIRYVRLEQTFPFASKEKAEIRYGAPFGQTRYPDTIYQTAENPDPIYMREPSYHIRIVRDWIDIADSRSAVTIASDHRMWTLEDNAPRSCMVRGIGWTSGGVMLNDDGTQKAVQRPPKGVYTFRYRIRPRTNERLPDGRTGFELNAPFHSVAVANGKVSAQGGLELPPMPDTTDTGIQITSVKPSEDGAGVVFRCFESLGKEAVIKLPQSDSYRWFCTDISETERIPVEGNTVHFRGCEIKSLLVELK